MPGAQPNRELVLIGLANLGGESEFVHTEDIAIECHKLFPDSFSWIKYPNLPDKDAVRVALTDARKEKYGALVEGRVGRSKTDVDGWRLTDAGLQWLAANSETIASESDTKGLKSHRQKLLKKLKRVRDHHLFRDYSDSPNQFAPSLGDIADLLRCRVDAEPPIWQKRFQNLHKQAMATKQDDVVEFLESCERSYERLR